MHRCESTNEQELELKEFILIVWRKRLMIIAICIIFIICSVVYNIFFVSPIYSSTSTIFLGNEYKITDSSFNANNLYANPQYASEFLSSDFLMGKVAEQLNLTKAQINRGKLKVEILKDAGSPNGMLRITMENQNPHLAKEVADKVALMFIDQSLERYQKQKEMIDNQVLFIKTRLDEIEHEISSAKKTLSIIDSAPISSTEKDLNRFRILDYLKDSEVQRLDLLDRYFRLLNSSYSLKKAEVIKSADEPTSPIKPKIKQDIVVSGILGFMIGVLLTFFREFLKRSSLSTKN